jgi:predicted CopG family antitoxin
MMFSWYSDSVRNVTISLPDDVYRRARIRAAEEDSSLSALVQRLLITCTQQESDFERRKRLQTEVLGTIAGFSAGDRLSRDEVHDRKRHHAPA